MLQRTYFHRYSTIEMYSLSRAYFTAQDKFQPQERYVAQWASDSSEKAFLYSYINASGQKFSIFIPTYIQDDPPNRFTQYDMLLTDALNFIKDYRKKRVYKIDPIDEFFLLPLMDMSALHWSVLKINLSANNQITVEHYDGAVLKKPDTQKTIENKVAEKLAAVTTFPFLFRQLDSVNCGPLSHNIICVLAEGKKPQTLPQASFGYRNKDLKLMKTAHAFQIAKQSQNADGVIFPGVEAAPDKPFLIRHRRTILLCLVAVAVVALLVPLHPFVIGAGVALVTAWSGLNTAALTAVSVSIAIPLTIALKAGSRLVAKGVRNLISMFKQTPQKTFDYSEKLFNTKKYIPSANFPAPLRIAKRSNVDLKKEGFDMQMDPVETDDFVEIKAATTVQPRRRYDQRRLISDYREFLERFNDTSLDESSPNCGL